MTSIWYDHMRIPSPDSAGETELGFTFSGKFIGLSRSLPIRNMEYAGSTQNHCVDKCSCQDENLENSDSAVEIVYWRHVKQLHSAQDDITKGGGVVEKRVKNRDHVKTTPQLSKCWHPQQLDIDQARMTLHVALSDCWDCTSSDMAGGRFQAHDVVAELTNWCIGCMTYPLEQQRHFSDQLQSWLPVTKCIARARISIYVDTPGYLLKSSALSVDTCTT